MKAQKRESKSDHSCSSYLRFCTFVLTTLKLTMKVNEFRGPLFFEGSPDVFEQNKNKLNPNGIQIQIGLCVFELFVFLKS
jgi:hypothetical protein